MASLTTSIPKGAVVLVTGATGFLASHICFQLLQRGFRVRGTVRDLEAASWILEGLFKLYAESGAIQLASVPRLEAEGAYDEAIKGVAAIIHTAYITNIVADPNEVITPSIAGIRAIMNAAIREPSVKQAVFTSSAMSATPLTPGIDNGTIGRDSWNEAALKASWAPPPYGLSHLVANYAASKLSAEREVWKFVEENKLSFTVNVISPAGIIGEPLHKKHIEGNANWIVHAYRGNRAAMDPLPATFYMNVKDMALIHIGAVLDPDVRDARIQAWGHSAHWNDILAVLRKIRPDRKFVDDYLDGSHIQVSVDQTESIALITRWSKEPNKTGFRPLDESIYENIMNPYLEE